MVDELIANQSFETLADLEEVLFQRCQYEASTARFDSRVNGFSLVDSNWGLIVSN
jgi:hypothetical protein